ncbi:hypothetical protein ACFLVX_03100 [Chloroflexota bacterium]
MTTIILTTGELLIDYDLTIIGPGADALTISGNNNSRIFNIEEPFQGLPPTVRIENLTIADGLSPDTTEPNGGGIYNRGNLTLLYCIVEQNDTTDRVGLYQQAGSGGGIYNWPSDYYPDTSGMLDIQNCIIRYNTTGDGDSRGGNGAGIYNNCGTVTILQSTIHDNTCGSNIDEPDTGPYKGGGKGGGILTEEGELTLTNCTVSHNFAGNAYFSDYGIPAPDVRSLDGGCGGGIMIFSGTVLLNNCTIVYNQAGTAGEENGYVTEEPGSGGGIADWSVSTTHAKNCIIADNLAPSGWGNDIFTIAQSGGVWGYFISHGCNIIGDEEDAWDYASGSDTTGDQLEIAPMLG